VDIVEMNDAFKIKAEIPGVKKEDVHVTLDNGVLTLEGERHQHREEEGFRFHRVESEYGNFIRSFTLPANVKSSGLKAHYYDGILELDIPKLDETSTKALAIPVE
jgi:HSP20 family protein